MKLFLVYLAGFLTPFLFLAFLNASLALEEWRETRRYRKAWHKFSEEFDALSAIQLAAHRADWHEQPWRFEQYHDDRARYFAQRWNHGLTKEI